MKTIQRLFQGLLAGILCLSVLTSCTAAEPQAQPAVQRDASAGDFVIERNTREAEVPMGEEDTWTIFIYMCGTDLESYGGFATLNLCQIMESVPGDNLKVVVQTGGTSAWGDTGALEEFEQIDFEGEPPTAAIDPSVLQRYEVTDELTLVDEQPLTSMGSEETLYEFLSWGVQEYPADKMGVILWNHGGGSLKGACLDELFNRDILLPFEISNAFESLYPEMTDRFEFIGFDACLMATIEVANILVPHARYLYASEETEPGFGWDYETIISEINANPQNDGGELGTVLCDGYYALNRMLGLETTCTLSVTDLEKVDNILYALDDLAIKIDENLIEPSFFAEVSRGVSRAERYAVDYQVDLGDMAEKLLEIAPDEAAALMAAVDEAVVHSVSGQARAFATGLSVYYPTNVAPAEVGLYDLSAPTPNYHEYVRWVQNQRMRLVLSGQQLVDVVMEPMLDSAGDFVMKIDTAGLDSVKNIGFQLYANSEDSEYSFVLGFDNDVIFNEDTGLVTDNFEALWAHFDGEPLMIQNYDFNDEYNLYQSPVLLNGVQTNLLLKWTWDVSEENNGHYDILGTFAGVDPETGMAARFMRQLQPGDEVTPLYVVVPYELVASEELANIEEIQGADGSFIYAPGNPVIVTESTAVEHSKLDPGRYLYQFGVIDIFNITQTYMPIAFDLDEAGSITSSEITPIPAPEAAEEATP